MPRQGSVRVVKTLSNIALQYKNSAYIFQDILKDVFVEHDTDKYWVLNSSFKLPETIRANGTPSKMHTWDASTSSYTVNEHALKDVITENDRDNSDLNLDQLTTEELTDKILLRQEYEAHELLFTITTFSNYAGTLTGDNLWGTTSSAPVLNMLSASSYIERYSGKTPNTVVMGRSVHDVLKESSVIYGRIQYVERQIVTKELLAALFDVDNVYVGSAVIDATKEGETATMTYLWGGDVLLAYFDPNPGGRKVTAACQFRVKKKGLPYRVKKWYEEDIEGDFIEVQTKCKPKAVATSCGYLLKGVNG
jgi:hypothetical protein